jgi:hypothetical protein
MVLATGDTLPKVARPDHLMTHNSYSRPGVRVRSGRLDVFSIIPSNSTENERSCEVIQAVRLASPTRYGWGMVEVARRRRAQISSSELATPLLLPRAKSAQIVPR